jgi:hypothetical protein
MKRIFLLLVLFALIGSVAYAVVFRQKSSKDAKVEKKDVNKKKHSNCGSYYN